MTAPRLLIHAGIVSYSSNPDEIDQFRYVLEFVDENGSSCIVWDGSSLAEALAAQAAWEVSE